MRALLVVAILLTLAFAQPAPATATHTIVHIRCTKLVDRVNLYRPDQRLYYTLCFVGYQRAREQAYAGRIWHDLRPVVRALTRAGICWRSVGEVIAWNNYAATARAFVDQWHASSEHWSLLMATKYDRGGGAWTSVNGRNFATYYVLDTC